MEIEIKVKLIDIGAVHAKWICIIDSVEQTINGNKYSMFFLDSLFDFIITFWQVTFWR